MIEITLPKLLTLLILTFGAGIQTAFALMAMINQKKESEDKE